MFGQKIQTHFERFQIQTPAYPSAEYFRYRAESLPWTGFCKPVKKKVQVSRQPANPTLMGHQIARSSYRPHLRCDASDLANMAVHSSLPVSLHSDPSTKHVVKHCNSFFIRFRYINGILGSTVNFDHYFFTRAVFICLLRG